MKSFKDSKGRTWTPRITTLVVDRYEQVTDKSLLDAVYNFVEESLQDKTSEEIQEMKSGLQLRLPVSKVVDLVRGLFGRFGDVPRLLYESIRWDETGNVTSVTYEDFANALPGECLEEATLSLYEALADFFQKALGAKMGNLGASLIGAAAHGEEKTSSD